LGDDDNASFTIDGDKLRTAADFDFEARSTYKIRVKTDDQHGGAFEQKLTITVIDVNEAPTVVGLTGASVDENQPVGTAVGTFASTDADGGDTHSYSLVAGTGDTDNALFTIAGTELRTGAVFDRESQDSYSVHVRSTDGDGLYLEQQFTVTVGNVNEVPTVDNQSVNTNEDTAAAIALTGRDVEGDALIISVVSPPANGSLIGTAPALIFIPDADYNGDDSFTFMANDGAMDSTLATVNITVTGVNDAPQISGSPDTHVDEDTPYSFTPDAADIDQETMTFSINRLPSWANFDSDSGQLSGTPSNTDVGTFEGIVIMVTDGNASAFLLPFDLTVVNVGTDLSVQQTVDNLTPSVNDTVVFTIVVTNNDLNPASDVYVTSILPSGLTYVSDDSGGNYDPASGRWNIGGIPGEPESNTAVINISASVNRTGALLIVASAADFDLIELNPADNSSAVTLNGEVQSDLGIAARVDNATPVIGDLITLTVSISNNGLDDADGVQVNYVLPAGLTYIPDDSGGFYDTEQGFWLVGDMPSGEKHVLNLTAMVDGADEIITTTTVASNGQMDPDVTNNRVSQVINPKYGRSRHHC